MSKSRLHSNLQCGLWRTPVKQLFSVFSREILGDTRGWLNHGIAWEQVGQNPVASPDRANSRLTVVQVVIESHKRCLRGTSIRMLRPQHSLTDHQGALVERASLRIRPLIV